MKRLLLLLLTLAAAPLAPLTAPAQSLFPPPAATGSAPEPPSFTPTPSASPGSNANAAAAGVPLPGQGGGPQIEKNIPLMPDTVTSASGGKSHRHRAQSGASAGLPATFQTEQDIQNRIRIRKAETRVQNLPAIQAEWAAAHQQRTDPARRAALAIYYKDFYARVLKLEPSLSTQIAARKQGALLRMQYPRLIPDATDPSASPTPAEPGPDYSTSGSPE